MGAGRGTGGGEFWVGSRLGADAEEVGWDGGERAVKGKRALERRWA